MIIVIAVEKLVDGMLLTAACAAATLSAPAVAGMAKLSETRRVCVDCKARMPAAPAAAAAASARRDELRAQKDVAFCARRVA